MTTDAIQTAAIPLRNTSVLKHALPTPIAPWISVRGQRLFEVGCGRGALARFIREQGPSEFHALNLQPSPSAAPYVDRLIVANVEHWTAEFPEAYFDGVILCHVLEHLAEPVKTLQTLRRLLKPSGRLYVCIPNIAFWRYRWRLLWGRFDCEPMGPMDETHLRFFTYDSIQDVLRRGGFEVERCEGFGHVPLPVLRKLLPWMCRQLDRQALRAAPGLFSYEIGLIGRPQ